MGSGFSFFVLTHKLQLELIPYGSDTFSARGFTEEVLQPHYERIMSVICAHPRRYILFCGSVFEVLFDGYIVDQHEFRLRKKDGSFTRQRARFANLLLPFRGTTTTAGLAQSFARQGIPMSAYGEECRARYAEGTLFTDHVGATEPL